MKHARAAYLILALFGLVSCADMGRTSYAKTEIGIGWRTSGEFDDREGPKNNSLHLIIDDTDYLITKNAEVGFSMLERRLYDRHGIPSKAIAACSGWWAGYGETYYAVLESDHIAVYHRELEEQVKIPPFRKVKRIELTHNES